MELHNIIEDIVIPKTEDIFNTIVKDGNPEKLCTCSQCRIDTACYALNRITPLYLVSNRGAARIRQEPIESQQKDADITALIYEGLKRVNHNQRPNFNHDSSLKDKNAEIGKPVFNIPTITGRIFNGNNFAPVSDIEIKLLYNGSLVTMKDGNWQNPFHLVHHTEGNFSFWPVPFPAEKTEEQSTFEFTIRVEAGEYEAFSHIFRIPVVSEILTNQSFSLGRVFKLTDLFLFPPGGEEHTRSLD